VHEPVSFHTALQVTLPTGKRRRGPRRPWAAGFYFGALAALFTGCASSPAPPQAPRGSPAAAGANANLSGFPAEFRQGYADGCASARGSRVRDEKRFAGEPQYTAGWRDGFDICGKR
jgi:hypothetical protein